MRYYELFEEAPDSKIFGMAKRAYQILSDDAKMAIDHWETANWTGGSLEIHIKNNDKVAQEIEAAFSPVRSLLPSKISLYRGIIKQGHYTTWEHGILDSWSSDKRVAEHFAGLRKAEGWKDLRYKVRSEDEINKIVSKYESTGFVKVDNRYYIRNKDHPEYYNIYNSQKSFITDGDDLKKDLMNDVRYAKERNEQLLAKAHVFEEEIDRDRVVWITNSAGCKEFIVRK